MVPDPKRMIPLNNGEWKDVPVSFPTFSLSSSVQSFSHVQLFATPWTAAWWLPYPSTAPRACSNSCPSSQWWDPLTLCHPILLPSIFPSSGSFQMSQFFTSGGQSIGVSVSASVLSMNIQDLFPLGCTGLISLQSTGLFKSLLQHHSSKGSSLWHLIQFSL